MSRGTNIAGEAYICQDLCDYDVRYQDIDGLYATNDGKVLTIDCTRSAVPSYLTNKADKARYKLTSAIITCPSVNGLDDRRYELEMQLMHSATDNSRRQLIISVLGAVPEAKAAITAPLAYSFFRNMTTKFAQSSGYNFPKKNVGQVQVLGIDTWSAYDLFPADHSFITYVESDRVVRILMKEPLSIPSEFIQVFKSEVLAGNNAYNIIYDLPFVNEGATGTVQPIFFGKKSETQWSTDDKKNHLVEMFTGIAGCTLSYGDSGTTYDLCVATEQKSVGRFVANSVLGLVGGIVIYGLLGIYPISKYGLDLSSDNAMLASYTSPTNTNAVIRAIVSVYYPILAIGRFGNGKYTILLAILTMYIMFMMLLYYTGTNPGNDFGGNSLIYNVIQIVVVVVFPLAYGTVHFITTQQKNDYPKVALFFMVLFMSPAIIMTIIKPLFFSYSYIDTIFFGSATILLILYVFGLIMRGLASETFANKAPEIASAIFTGLSQENKDELAAKKAKEKADADAKEKERQDIRHQKSEDTVGIRETSGGNQNNVFYEGGGFKNPGEYIKDLMKTLRKSLDENALLDIRELIVVKGELFSKIYTELKSLTLTTDDKLFEMLDKTIDEIMNETDSRKMQVHENNWNKFFIQLQTRPEVIQGIVNEKSDIQIDDLLEQAQIMTKEFIAFKNKLANYSRDTLFDTNDINYVDRYKKELKTNDTIQSLIETLIGTINKQSTTDDITNRFINQMDTIFLKIANENTTKQLDLVKNIIKLRMEKREALQETEELKENRDKRSNERNELKGMLTKVVAEKVAAQKLLVETMDKKDKAEDKMRKFEKLAQEEAEKRVPTLRKRIKAEQERNAAIAEKTAAEAARNAAQRNKETAKRATQKARDDAIKARDDAIKAHISEMGKTQQYALEKERLEKQIEDLTTKISGYKAEILKAGEKVLQTKAERNAALRNKKLVEHARDIVEQQRVDEYKLRIQAETNKRTAQNERNFAQAEQTKAQMKMEEFEKSAKKSTKDLNNVVQSMINLVEENKRLMDAKEKADENLQLAIDEQERLRGRVGTTTDELTQAQIEKNKAVKQYHIANKLFNDNWKRIKEAETKLEEMKGYDADTFASFNINIDDDDDDGPRTVVRTSEESAGAEQETPAPAPAPAPAQATAPAPVSAPAPTTASASTAAEAAGAEVPAPAPAPAPTPTSVPTPVPAKPSARKATEPAAKTSELTLQAEAGPARNGAEAAAADSTPAEQVPPSAALAPVAEAASPAPKAARLTAAQSDTVREFIKNPSRIIENYLRIRYPNKIRTIDEDRDNTLKEQVVPEIKKNIPDLSEKQYDKILTLLILNYIRENN